MEIAANDRLAQLLAEREHVSAAALANFLRPTGGRGKQGKLRTDAALKRAVRFHDQLRRLDSQIRALGGVVPTDEPDPAPAVPVVVPADPHTMTREALQAEDAALEQERRATRAPSLSLRHRAIKSALGKYAAADLRARNAARRSAAAKRGAATRVQRKAAGLPPKAKECFMPPPGGWTDADRVG